MSFDDVILNRRSIRKYLNNDVSLEKIKKIIEFGILAPSAHNRQPWKVMILDKNMKDKVYEALLSKRSSDISIEMTANIINEAPCLIVVFYDNTGNGSRDNDMLSIGAFIENMHLKATEMGLGSLWIANTNHIKEEISSITNISFECISCLALGHKNQNPKARPRKSIEEIIVK